MIDCAKNGELRIAKIVSGLRGEQFMTQPEQLQTLAGYRIFHDISRRRQMEPRGPM